MRNISPHDPNSPKLHEYQDCQPLLCINSPPRSGSRELKEPCNPHQLATVVENQTPFPRSERHLTQVVLFLASLSPACAFPRQVMSSLIPAKISGHSFLASSAGAVCCQLEKKNKKRNDGSFLYFQSCPSIIQRDDQLAMGCLLR